MNIKDEQYERLMRFLDLDMSPDEMIAFAAELEASPELREQLYFEEDIREGLNESNLQDIKESFSPQIVSGDDTTIQSHKQNMDQRSEDEPGKVLSFNTVSNQESIEKKHKGNVLKVSFPVAIAATLLIAVALVYLFNIGSPSSGGVLVKNRGTNHIKKKEDNLVKTQVDTAIQTPAKHDINFASLFAGAYKKDPAPNAKPDIYASALDDYNDNYYRTIQKIDAYHLPKMRAPANDPLNNKKYVTTIGHYYTGLSFIETNYINDAIKNLQWVTDNADDKNYIIKGQWYLALAYLKSGNTDSAQIWLRKVSDNTTLLPYQTKAKNLLKKME